MNDNVRRTIIPILLLSGMIMMMTGTGWIRIIGVIAFFSVPWIERKEFYRT